MVGWTWWLELSSSAGSAPLTLYKTWSAAVYSSDASIIEVEVDVSGIKTNEDYFHTVGLPDATVREGRDRVRAALKNCGYDIPAT
jgi:magnesium chelatase family protein